MSGARIPCYIMKKTRYLKVDFFRLLKKYPLYLAIVGVAVSLWFSLENYAFESGMVNGNVMDTYMYSIQMSGKMIAYAFCASAFASAFCEDLENHYMRYSIGRGNLFKYVFSKNIVIYISSIIAMILGTFLFVGYLRLRLPWTTEVETANISGMYKSLWGTGHFAAYIFMCALQMGMLAGALSVAASFISIFITNKMVIMLTPILLYQILLEIGGSGWKSVMIFDPTLFQFESDMVYFFIVCMFSLVPSVLFGWGIYREMRKRL